MIETPEMYSLTWENGKSKPRRRLQPSRGVADYSGVDMNEPICVVDGCNRIATRFKKTLCKTHDGRRLRGGDPHIDRRRTATPESMRQRFWAKVDKTGPLGCWVWTASLDGKGYGQFVIMRADRGYPQRAHRVAWELLRGPIPDRLVVDHRCRNRICVNPDHLELVTNEENIARGLWTPVLNVRKTHCKRGHPFDEENTYRPPGRPHTRQCITCAKIRASVRRGKQ